MSGAGRWRANVGSRFPLGGVQRDSEDWDSTPQGGWAQRGAYRGRAYCQRGRAGGRGRGEIRGGGRSWGPQRPTSENDSSWKFLHAITRPSNGFRDTRGVDRFLESCLVCGAEDASRLLDNLGDTSPDGAAGAGLTRIKEACEVSMATLSQDQSSLNSMQQALALMCLVARTLRNAGNLQTAKYNSVLLTVARNINFPRLAEGVVQGLLQGHSPFQMRSSLRSPHLLAICTKDSDGAEVEDSTRSMWESAADWLTMVLDVVIQRVGLGLKDMDLEYAGLSKSVKLLADMPLQVMGGLPPPTAARIRRVERVLQLQEHARASTLLSPEDRRRRMDELLRLKYLNASQEIPVQDFPGEFRPLGPRHNNDHGFVAAMSVTPTCEEVLCKVAPYLPANRPGGSPHLERGSPEAHVDVHFRLLRMDLIGNLTESIQSFVESGGTRSSQTSTGRAASRCNDHELTVYRNAKITGLMTQTSQGVPTNQLLFRVQFQDLPMNQGRRLQQRARFWQRTSRLAYGTLCGIFHDKEPATPPDIVFLTVADNPQASGQADAVTIMLQPCNPADIFTLARMAGTESNSRNVALVQADGSWFAYAPVLRALQSCELPAWYHPHISDQSGAATKAIHLPGFLNENTCLDLSCLCVAQTNGKELSVSDMQTMRRVYPGRMDDFPEESIARATGLDEAQIEALKSAFTQDLVLIQGPPGTGKTYLGVKIILALLANGIGGPSVLVQRARETFGLDRISAPDFCSDEPGPVLCLCYTNHALDQFLESLVKAGVTNIVRVGGRSTSEILQSKNINNIRYVIKDYRIAKLNGTKDKLRQELDGLINELKEQKEPTWRHLRPVIEATSPDVYESLEEAAKIFKYTVDEDHFMMIDEGWDFFTDWRLGQETQYPNDPSFVYAFAHRPEQYANHPGILLENSLYVDNAYTLSMAHRAALYEDWREKWLEHILSRLREVTSELEAASKEQAALKDRSDLARLKGARVVGMTTTGASTKQGLIKSLNAQVLVVEEAAEVLEAHVLAAITEHTQQIILIGDHKQLRPKIETYKLSFDSKQGYNLDVSMFERLVHRPGEKYTTLKTQWRMHPSIARLIKTTVYPDLQDALRVSSYPPVKGMLNSLYFMTHREPEQGGRASEEEKSKSNTFEAEMAVGLAMYLMQQGYKDDDVTILTPYLGQLQKIKVLLQSKMTVVLNSRDETDLQIFMEHEMDGFEEKTLEKRVRVATIDNFQGEESTVVIVSLVRSNENGNIGFLRVLNRVNVLLSRAMHGMYLLGNADCLRTCNKDGGVWEKILNILESQNSLGPSLQLRCANHPDTVTCIQAPGQFPQLVGEGGCTLRCEVKLPNCGHQCPRQCHPEDAEHKHVICPEVCPRLHKPCGHLCPKPCGEECGVCLEIIPEVALPQCNHPARNVPCHEAQDPTSIACKEVVQIVMPECAHTLKVPCHRAGSLLSDASLCTHQCAASLLCGHPCRTLCGMCKAQNTHGQCTQTCGRMLTCGHSCADTCHADNPCPPCTKPCTVRCVHSRCQHACDQACAPCAEPCAWECPHVGACNLPCGAPCTRLPCNLRCGKLLECGHQCPGICGEECPSPEFCIVCASDDVKNQQVDMILMTTFGESDPSSDPLVFLPCKHVFSMSTMDGWLGLAEVYSQEDDSSAQEATRKWVAPIPLSNALSLESKGCPNCRRSIFGVRRYGRVLQKVCMDVSYKRYLMEMDEFQQQIGSYLKEASSNIQDMQNNENNNAIREQAMSRVKRCMTTISKHQDRCTSSPAHRVHDACVATLIRQGADMEQVQNDGPKQLDMRPLIKCKLAEAQAKLLKCTIHHINVVSLSRMLGNNKNSQNNMRTQLDVYKKNMQGAVDAAAQAAEVAVQTRAYRSAFQAHMLSAQVELQAATDEAALVNSLAMTETERQAHLDSRLKHLDSAMKAAANCSLDGRTTHLSEEDSMSLQELNKAIKVAREADVNTVAGLNVGERHNIWKAINLTGQGWTGQGHWYTCPNGHPYVITECGGATEESKCPECGATIGGTSHRLHSSNQQLDTEQFFAGAR